MLNYWVSKVTSAIALKAMREVQRAKGLLVLEYGSRHSAKWVKDNTTPRQVGKVSFASKIEKHSIYILQKCMYVCELII